MVPRRVEHEPKPDHRIFYRHIAAGDIVRARVLVESIVGDPDA
ncbi:hypothetical protein SEA_ANARQUE_52 [Gordonia phage AnarQue]|nr:hypothetical protein SEA_ANARQUE_52 [Gordonia phage AnarQue]